MFWRYYANIFALTIYYQPTVVEAFASVQLILAHVNCLLNLFIAGLHIARVYLTGGLFGVTGYSLPWDQVGYWACKIVTSVPEAFDNLIPGIGKIFSLRLRAGFSVNQSTLTRLYSIYTFVFPLVTLILVIIHFSMLRKQGISGPL